jgi:hypothetical protein
MQQTKIDSFIETLVNTFIGFWVSWWAWIPIAWYYDVPLNSSSHFGIIACFTILSVLRGYIVRRWFATWLHNLSLKIATFIGEIYVRYIKRDNS